VPYNKASLIAVR